MARRERWGHSRRGALAGPGGLPLTTPSTPRTSCWPGPSQTSGQPVPTAQASVLLQLVLQVSPRAPRARIQGPLA